MKITKAWMDEIFWPKVEKHSNGCWEWQAQRLPHGYGQVHFKREKYYPHRIIWIYIFGKIPKGMCVLHRCDNPPCVNPGHLFLGTCKDNTQDMMNKGRGPIGERQGKSKLTEEIVRYIIANYDAAPNKKEFAKSLKISPSHCCGIAKGNYWKHLQNLKR